MLGSNTEYSLINFLNDKSLNQGIVTIGTAFHTILKIFLIKVNMNDGNTYLYGDYFIDNFTNNFIPLEHSSMKYFAMYNGNKFIIYNNEFYPLINNNLKEILEENKFAKFIFSQPELLEYVKKDCKEKCLKELNNKFTDYLKIDKYRNKYSEFLNKCKTSVENEYFKNERSIDFSVDTDHFYYDKVNLHKYIIDKTLIDKYAEELTSREDYFLIINFLRYKAEEKLLKQIKDNPSKKLLEYMDIKKSIEQSGKTLNILTTEDKEIKIKNLLYNNGTFQSYQGRIFISQNDIKEIYFRGKILWKRKI